MKPLCAVWLVVVGSELGRAKLSSGVINSQQNWAFLDRFCFVSEDGMLHYYFQYPVKYEMQSIYFYFDTADQWKSAYDSGKTCQQRESVLDPGNNQIVHLTTLALQFGNAECVAVNQSDGEEWYHCQGNRSFLSRRPRWWYLAVGNCDSNKGLYLEYSMLMTNGKVSNRWFYHFSFDEFCKIAIAMTMCVVILVALPISMFFMVSEVLELVVATSFVYMLKARNMFHSTFKMFLHALALDLTCLVFIWLHYDRYADDGRGFPQLKATGLMFRQVATVVFTMLLLLMAKGYTITRGKLPSVTVLKLLIFAITYLLGHVVMLVWELVVFDPAAVAYMSESLPAYLIAGLRLVAWLWYCRSSYVTVKKYPRKRCFYAMLGALITLWFWAGPVALVLANFVLDNWVREEVMLGVEGGVMLYGFAVFLVLISPLPDNHNFPYHVRTNQVTQENYPQNVYEVQYSSSGNETA